MRIVYLVDHMDAVPVLAGLFHKEWSYLYPGTMSVEVVAERIGERMHKNRIPLTLVAYEGAELVGTVSLKVHDMDAKPDLTPWLAGLYVLENRRGAGIGARLVSEAEEKALSLGVGRLYLYTERAEGLYSRLGWSVLERITHRGHSVMVMTKELAFDPLLTPRATAA